MVQMRREAARAKSSSDITSSRKPSLVPRSGQVRSGQLPLPEHLCLHILLSAHTSVCEPCHRRSQSTLPFECSELSTVCSRLPIEPSESLTEGQQPWRQRGRSQQRGQQASVRKDEGVAWTPRTLRPFTGLQWKGRKMSAQGPAGIPGWQQDWGCPHTVV